MTTATDYTMATPGRAGLRQGTHYQIRLYLDGWQLVMNIAGLRRLGRAAARPGAPEDVVALAADLRGRPLAD